MEEDIRAGMPLRLVYAYPLYTCNVRFDMKQDFFSTEMFVRDRSGGPQIPAIGRQDSLCAVPLVCSARWIREMNQESAVTRDVKCPGTTSIGGHEVSFQGVVRNMVFTLKGLTFRRDVWVCDQLDYLYDFVFGASFIKQNFRLLFQKMFRGTKNIFAGWFTKSKETPGKRIPTCSLTIADLKLRRRKKGGGGSKGQTGIRSRYPGESPPGQASCRA